MVTPPKAATLKKYGLSREEWLAILERQGGVCAICEKVPPNGRLCTDHQHIPKWKKLPPAQRKVHVRGLLCAYCNLRLMRKGWTLKKLERGVEYMKQYEQRVKENTWKP
jgi:hypothetical protein